MYNILLFFLYFLNGRRPMLRNLLKNNRTSSPTQNVNTNALNTNLYILNTTEKGECPLDFPYKLRNASYCAKECNATDFFMVIVQ